MNTQDLNSVAVTLLALVSVISMISFNRWARRMKSPSLVPIEVIAGVVKHDNGGPGLYFSVSLYNPGDVPVLLYYLLPRLGGFRCSNLVDSSKGLLVQPHTPTMLEGTQRFDEIDTVFPDGVGKDVSLVLKWYSGGKDGGIRIKRAMRIVRSGSGSFGIPYYSPSPVLRPHFLRRLVLRARAQFARWRRNRRRRTGGKL